MRTRLLSFIRSIPVALLVIFALHGSYTVLCGWISNQAINLTLALVAITLIFWGASRDIARQARERSH